MARERDEAELQLDATTGERLQKACRRCDLIESVHTGPMLARPWATGFYLFVLPHAVKHRRRKV